MPSTLMPVNGHLDELYVGRSSWSRHCHGHLRWNQTETIDANAIYFARGGGATGVLDVPTGGTLLLGTAADPVGRLYIADNNTGGANTVANLDFSLTNPNLTAYLGELGIGLGAGGGAEGTLKLASNSTLNLGTVATPADLNIGWNYSGGPTASPVGVLDALNACRACQRASRRTLRRSVQFWSWHCHGHFALEPD